MRTLSCFNEKSQCFTEIFNSVLEFSIVFASILQPSIPTGFESRINSRKVVFFSIPIHRVKHPSASILLWDILRYFSILLLNKDFPRISAP